MKGILDPYPVVVDQTVVWSDTDANGHVNTAMYLRYMENGRVEFYNRIGKYAVEKERGITLVIKSSTCHFLSPLSYPDKISIGARVKEIRDDQIFMEYVVVNRLCMSAVARGEATIVAFWISSRTKVPIPPELKKRISDLQPEL